MGIKLIEIKNLISEAIPDAEILIEDLAGDNNHYSATITSKVFKGKSKIEVYTKFIVMILTMFTNLIFSVVAGVIFYYLIKLTYKNRKLFYFKR